MCYVSSIKLLIQTVVVEIARRNVDEVLFFFSLEMKIPCVLAENSLHTHNCGKEKKKQQQQQQQNKNVKKARLLIYLPWTIKLTCIYQISTFYLPRICIEYEIKRKNGKFKI